MRCAWVKTPNGFSTPTPSTIPYRALAAVVQLQEQHQPRRLKEGWCVCTCVCVCVVGGGVISWARGPSLPHHGPPCTLRWGTE